MIFPPFIIALLSTLRPSLIFAVLFGANPWLAAHWCVSSWVLSSQHAEMSLINPGEVLPTVFLSPLVELPHIWYQDACSARTLEGWQTIYTQLASCVASTAPSAEAACTRLAEAEAARTRFAEAEAALTKYLTRCEKTLEVYKDTLQASVLTQHNADVATSRPSRYEDTLKFCAKVTTLLAQLKADQRPILKKYLHKARRFYLDVFYLDVPPHTVFDPLLSELKTLLDVPRVLELPDQPEGQPLLTLAEACQVDTSAMSAFVDDATVTQAAIDRHEFNVRREEIGAERIAALKTPEEQARQKFKKGLINLFFYLWVASFFAHLFIRAVLLMEAHADDNYDLRNGL